MTEPRYNSRRADCPGYLEFIWRLPTDAPHPQAIAYIAENESWFYGCYGTQVVNGPTVADVKAALFPLLDVAA
jgi:hypothetical protein